MKNTPDEDQTERNRETSSEGVPRRTFLLGAGAVTTGAMVPNLLPGRAGAAVKQQAPAAPATNPSLSPVPDGIGAPVPADGNGVFVLVILYGGNDGLNTVVPYTDATYLNARGSLGVQPTEVLRLNDRFGLHPNLKGLKGLWDQQRLAVVHGVGYPNPSRSHFRSMDIWQTAVPDTFQPLGWLGRWHDATGPDPLRMVALGTSLPRAMIGAKGSGAVLPTGAVRLPGGGAQTAAYKSLSAASGLGPWGDRVAGATNDLLRVIDNFGPVLNASKAPAIATGTNLEAGVVAPAAKSDLEIQLDEVATLIKAKVPTRAFAVSLGGFDTHASEKDTHARLLAILDTALTSFAHQVAGLPVTVLVHSEFGRRVAANLSSGTDHGTAAPVLVLGPQVKGGFFGDPPSLTDLDQGDLKFTTDFRSVYATVLGSVLGVDPALALGKPFAAVPFV